MSTERMLRDVVPTLRFRVVVWVAVWAIASAEHFDLELLEVFEGPEVLEVPAGILFLESENATWCYG